ncbi:hypothetical protein OC842_003936 [Tilletia horrida]|uniref:Tubulin-specific chaperone D n=1 Tax=Tilletia horrida TaxID=155126 RepID=A0AAN6GAJ1_9BASI|nr:hypothetical protein OC842_003936 [Tilletia horrida]
MSAVDAARPVVRGGSDGDDPASGAMLPGREDEVGVEERELASFEHIEEFRALLADFLAPKAIAAVDAQNGAAGSANASQSARNATAAPNSYQNPALTRLLDILSPYQEQPYLLDPYLDELVSAPVQALQKIIRSDRDAASEQLYSARLQELAVLIYWYTKIRGDKVITRFFPHEVDDLLPVIVSLERLISTSNSTPTSKQAQPPRNAVWELRYVLLLWLSLVCMIPFDLRQLDEVARQTSDATSNSSVAERIESLGRNFLASPGKERDAAAVMMGKLFQRRDMKTDPLARFLDWSRQFARSDASSAFLQTGIMQALCEIIKISDPPSIEEHLPALQGLFECFDSSAPSDSSLSTPSPAPNVLILRYEAKMACRLGLKLLKPRKVNRTKNSKSLDANLKGSGQAGEGLVHSGADADEADDLEEDIPEEIDQFVSKLLTCLESKDTAVRYSAAKGLARLCERLPPTFVSQLTDAVRSLFAINVIERAKDDVDLSNASEHTWQGACMAIAELARRGLLDPSELEQTMKWILRALTFDVRRGANSVGSAVRDAACYVLWALARAHTNAEALRSHAESMATRLLIVATLDREVSIRRAASAAFQECVGRMGNIPHGIDVLRKTDFYAVGVRRNAFVRCAPEVASHDVYRQPLLEHLLTVTIAHWDRSMRSLAAEAIKALVDIDYERQAPDVAQKLLAAVKRPDAFTVHGSLLALSQLAELSSNHLNSPAASHVIQACLDALHQAPFSVLRSVSAAWPLFAACELIRTTSTTLLSAQLKGSTKMTIVVGSDTYERIRPHEFKDEFHAALTFTLARLTLSDLALCYFRQRPDLFEETTNFLLSLLLLKGSLYSTVIEVRRNAVRSIDETIQGLGDSFASIFSTDTSQRTLDTLLASLEDYTVDQRGDVGSWVRIAALTALTHFVEQHARQVGGPALVDWLPKEQVDRIMAGVLKQTVERIDAVREHAGAQLVAILKCSPPLPTVEGKALLDAALPVGQEIKFQDASWAFPRIVSLLEVEVYRVPVLRGIAISIASKSDMAQRFVGTSLLDWANAEEGRYSLLLRELYTLAAANFGSNTTFVPVLTTATLLIEGGAVEDLDGATDENLARKFCRIASQNADKMKSLARVQASAALCMNLLRLPAAQARALDTLPLFLLHTFTAVRTSAAEQLYVVLQDIVEDELPEEAEEILLNTKWAHRVQKVQTAKLQRVLKAHLLPQ